MRLEICSLPHRIPLPTEALYNEQIPGGPVFVPDPLGPTAVPLFSQYINSGLSSSQPALNY